MHLPYKSPLLRTLSTLLFSPFLLLGSSRETSTATLHLLLNFLEKGASSADAIRFARITLGNAMVQTYSASLLIETHFQGLAYFMHKWWLTTAIVSILNIMLVEIVFVSLVWTLLTGEDNGDGEADDVADREKGAELQHSPGQRDESAEADDNDDGNREKRNAVNREDNGEGEPAIPLSSSKSDSDSQRENDDNDTLDGESMTERSFYHATTTTTTGITDPRLSVIDPQVLTGMLQSGAPSSTFPINRTPRHQHLAQSGNFSYPYSRSSNSSCIPVVADTRRVPPAVVELSRSMSPSLTPSSSSSLQRNPPPASTVSDSDYTASTTVSAVVNGADDDGEAVVPLTDSLVMMDTTITPDDLDLSTNSSIHHEFGEDTTIPVLDELQNEEEGVNEFDMAGLLEKEDDLFL